MRRVPPQSLIPNEYIIEYIWESVALILLYPSLKKSNIEETKMQTCKKKGFLEIINLLLNNNRNYYSYQLKSSKGLVVVLNGIESLINSNKVKEVLEECCYDIKAALNKFIYYFIIMQFNKRKVLRYYQCSKLN